MFPRTLIPLLFACTAPAQSPAFDQILFRGGADKGIFFVVNPRSGNRSLQFVRFGEFIPGTNWKPVKFEFKEIPKTTGGWVEVSEVTIRHVKTGRTAILVHNKLTDISK